MNTKRIIAIGVSVILCALVGMLISRYMFKQTIKEAIDEEWRLSEQEDIPEYMKEIDRKSSYRIVKIDKGNICKVQVVVQGVDLANEMRKIPIQDLPKMADEQEINTYVIGLIEKSEMVETEANIYVEKNPKGYDVTFSDVFVDAMSGKLYTYSIEVMEEILGE